MTDEQDSGLKPDSLSDRDEFGRFLRGNKIKGGRPKGARSETTRLFDELAAGAVEEIGRAVIDDAKTSDGASRKILLNRMWGRTRGRTIEFDLPPIESVADVPKALGAVLMAVADGELAPEEANAIAGAIAVHHRALEVSEFEARIEGRIAELERLAQEYRTRSEP